MVIPDKGFRHVGIVEMRFEHDVWLARLGVCIAHVAELCGQRVRIWQLRLDSVELRHHVVDHVHRLAQQPDAFAREREVRGSQALAQPFQRRQQLCQQRNVDHGDRAVQRVRRAKQLFAHGQLAIAALDRTTNRLKILSHFAAQDFQQYRVHRRHHRHGDSVIRRKGFVSGSVRHEPCQCGSRHRIGGNLGAGDTSTHGATHRFGTHRRTVFQARRLARSQLFRGTHDRAEGRTRLTFALERIEQLGQRLDGVPHQRLNIGIRLDAAVEHAIEHVLDFPGELAQYAGTDQSSGALQGMERTADADQRGCLRRIGKPVLLGRAQIVDLFLHFLQEDLANVVINAFGMDVELGVLGQYVAHRNLLDHLFLDFDPVAFLIVRVAALEHRRGGGLGLGQPQSVQVVYRFGGRATFAKEQAAHVFAWQQADRLGKLRMSFAQWHRDRRDELGGRHGGNRVARCGHRPVTQQAKAVLGHVEYVFKATAMFARCLEVILQCSQCVGEMIHLRAAGHAPILQQFVIDEATDALGEFGRAW